MGIFQEISNIRMLGSHRGLESQDSSGVFVEVGGVGILELNRDHDCIFGDGPEPMNSSFNKLIPPKRSAPTSYKLEIKRS